MPIGSSDTEIIEEERTGLGSGDGDHDRFRHYVRKEKLTEALINGTPEPYHRGRSPFVARRPEGKPIEGSYSRRSRGCGSRCRLALISAAPEY
jgi:hypothetical protein